MKRTKEIIESFTISVIKEGPSSEIDKEKLTIIEFVQERRIYTIINRIIKEISPVKERDSRKRDGSIPNPEISFEIFGIH